MEKQRIGFVDKCEGSAAHALRRATLILSRQEDAPSRYGRAAVRSLSETGSARIVGTGVVVCYGSSESDVARHMLSVTDSSVVVVTKSKPRKGGEIEKATERLLGSGSRVESVVVKKGAAFAGDCSPGGAFEVVEDLAAPIRVSTAPSIPRTKVREVKVSRPRLKPRIVEVVEVSRPRLEPRDVSPVEVSRPRLERPPVVSSSAPAPRLARPAATGDRTIAASTPGPSEPLAASHAPVSAPEVSDPSETPPEVVEAPVASPGAQDAAED